MREWNSKLKGPEKKAADCLNTTDQAVSGSLSADARFPTDGTAEARSQPSHSVSSPHRGGPCRLCLFCCRPLDGLPPRHRSLARLRALAAALTLPVSPRPRQRGGWSQEPPPRRVSALWRGPRRRGSFGLSTRGSPGEA